MSVKFNEINLRYGFSCYIFTCILFEVCYEKKMFTEKHNLRWVKKKNAEKYVDVKPSPTFLLLDYITN